MGQTIGNMNSTGHFRLIGSQVRCGSRCSSTGPYLEEKERSINDLVSTKKYCAASYCPSNESGTAKDRVTIEHALAFSYNISALRLMHQTGLESSFQYLEKLEWSKLTPGDRQYSGGTYEPPRAIISVTDVDGDVLFEWETQETVV